MPLSRLPATPLGALLLGLPLGLSASSAAAAGGDDACGMIKHLIPELDAFNEFGADITSGTDFIAIGAPGDNEFGSSAGAVWIYRTADAGAPLQPVEKLVPKSVQLASYVGRELAAARLDADRRRLGTRRPHRHGVDL